MPARRAERSDRVGRERDNEAERGKVEAMHQSWVTTSSEGENGDGINSRAGLEEDAKRDSEVCSLTCMTRVHSLDGPTLPKGDRNRTWLVSRLRERAGSIPSSVRMVAMGYRASSPRLPCVCVCTRIYGEFLRERGNNCGWIRGKNGVNGKLKICDEISQVRSETNEPKQMVQGLWGLGEGCARLKEEAQPEHYRNVSGCYSVTVTAITSD